MLLSQQLQAELAAGGPLLHGGLQRWAADGWKAGQCYHLALLCHQRFGVLFALLPYRLLSTVAGVAVLLWPKVEGMQHCEALMSWIASQPLLCSILLGTAAFGSHGLTCAFCVQRLKSTSSSSWCRR